MQKSRASLQCANNVYCAAREQEERLAMDNYDMVSLVGSAVSIHVPAPEVLPCPTAPPVFCPKQQNEQPAIPDHVECLRGRLSMRPEAIPLCKPHKGCQTGWAGGRAIDLCSKRADAEALLVSTARIQQLHFPNTPALGLAQTVTCTSPVVQLTQELLTQVL